jgi:predicted AAA+ superfamily ATPase
MGMNRQTYINASVDVLSNQDVMLFLMGARQVGKTVLSKSIAALYKQSFYLNFDDDEHRKLILSGQRFIENIFPAERRVDKPLVIFDEIHKYPNWKNFIKGFYDVYKQNYNIVVTGSSRLDIFYKGGDSLMGRYLPYTVHPFSLGELNPNDLEGLYRLPCQIQKEDWTVLYEFGGFPVPFFKRQSVAYRQWRRMRRSQLFREDIRDMTHVHEISQLELCAQLLEYQSGGILNRSALGQKLRVSLPTIGRWLEILKQFYFAFTIQPWAKNIPHSLIKEPKVYLNDWSLIADPGARFENFIACHLKKSIDFWSESGQGDFELYFLRDKSQREVDFLVTRDQEPWLLVEAKSSEQNLTPALSYYQKLTTAPFAFQVTKNMPYYDFDCFSKEGVFIVPAQTFLSQLV